MIPGWSPSDTKVAQWQVISDYVRSTDSAVDQEGLCDGLWTGNSRAGWLLSGSRAEIGGEWQARALKAKNARSSRTTRDRPSHLRSARCAKGPTTKGVCEVFMWPFCNLVLFSPIQQSKPCACDRDLLFYLSGEFYGAVGWNLPLSWCHRGCGRHRQRESKVWYNGVFLGWRATPATKSKQWSRMGAQVTTQLVPK